MKYKKCGNFGVLMTEEAEDVKYGLTFEIDSEGPVTVTRSDGRQYTTVSDGAFFIPAAFLIGGRYSFTVGDVRCAAFRVEDGKAFRAIDSVYDEISNMWIAIAELVGRAESAEREAEAARAAVEEFRDGYRTE